MPNFINKHTAIAVLILALGCFFVGYYVGQANQGSTYAAPVQPACPPWQTCK